MTQRLDKRFLFASVGITRKIGLALPLKKSNRCELRNRGDGEADTADDEIGWHLVGSESEQLHGVVELDRPEDEAIVFKLGEAELQRVANPHREDGWLRRLIGNGGVVVAVDDGEGVWR